MSRRRSRDEGPGLFDLPLDGPVTAVPEEPDPPVVEADEEEPLLHEPEPRPSNRPSPRKSAPLSARLLAGLADLAVHLALAVALLFGSRLLGVEAGLGDWPALVLFLLVFSFLYTVLPLAFFGQTPGMAWAGLVARGTGGESLTFGQTGRRWLAGVLTMTLLGLPAVPAAGGGRSLTDRLSGSDTYLA
ncbi:MAG TPA: RDD family protein [Thermoanaerobaculia bacterium]|nr:RDD family protein [Thermoanaerobaculia bacterium]